MEYHTLECMQTLTVDATYSNRIDAIIPRVLRTMINPGMEAAIRALISLSGHTTVMRSSIEALSTYLILLGAATRAGASPSAEANFTGSHHDPPLRDLGRRARPLCLASHSLPDRLLLTSICA